MEENQTWYVVQTRIQAEQKAAKNLRDAGYTVFVPTFRKSMRHHRSKAWIIREFLLFSRYIFVALGDQPDFGPAHDCDGFAGVLGLNGAPYPVPGSEMSRLFDDQDKHRFDAIRPSEEQDAREYHLKLKATYKRGTRIHAVAGPFGGFSGQVERVTGRSTIRALVKLFGGLTPVEFDARDVEKMEAA